MNEERISQAATPVVHQAAKRGRGKSLQEDYRHSMPQADVPRLAYIVKEGCL